MFTQTKSKKAEIENEKYQGKTLSWKRRNDVRKDEGFSTSCKIYM